MAPELGWISSSCERRAQSGRRPPGRLLRHADDQMLQVVTTHDAPGLRVIRGEIPAVGLAVIRGAICPQDCHLRISGPIEPAFGGAAAAEHVERADRLLHPGGEALT